MTHVRRSRSSCEHWRGVEVASSSVDEELSPLSSVTKEAKSCRTQASCGGEVSDMLRRILGWKPSEQPRGSDWDPWGPRCSPCAPPSSLPLLAREVERCSAACHDCDMAVGSATEYRLWGLLRDLAWPMPCAGTQHGRVDRFP